MQQAPMGPTLLGFDVIWIATMLSAVAAFAVLLAIYAATTVKDPMARRVKALNERYCKSGPQRFFLCHRRRQCDL